ncbi:MAG: LysM peptidoglycan-binding domain-containing protein [Propionibacteriaceae bacterium]|nr:LysM peptidoglycan-binding domain-containing protein [Propionibacteriaceae bacterium]
MDVSDPPQMSRGGRGSPARAIAAGLVLAILLLGVPLVLLRWGAWRELEDVARHPELLLLPDDGHLVLAVMTAAGVIFWVALAVCIIIEIVDAIRFRMAQRTGSQAPPPRARGLRSLVRPLVTALFAVAFMGGGLQGTAIAAPSVAQSAAVTSTTRAPLDRLADEQVGEGPSHVRNGPSAVNAEYLISDHMVTVEPGDTLWSIASEELGDGRRWKEIAEANADLITDPGLIRPGWEMVLPEDDDTRATTTGGADLDANTSLGPPVASAEVTGADDGQRRTSVWDQAAVPPTNTAGTTPTPIGEPPGQGASMSHEATITVAQSPPASDTEASLDSADAGRSKSAAGVAGASALVAAGLAALLWRRRREQLRSRPVGRRILQPNDEGRRLETALGVAGSFTTASKNMVPFDSMVSEIHDREICEIPIVNGLAENFTVLPLEAGGDYDLPENGVTVCVGEDERTEAVCVGLGGLDPFLICAEQPETASLVARGLAMNLAVGENSTAVELHLVTTENLFATFDSIQCHRTFEEGVTTLAQVVTERRGSLDNREWRTLRSDPDKAEAWRPVVFCFIPAMSPAELSQVRQTLGMTEVGVVAVAAIASADLRTLELRGANAPRRLVVESLERALLEPSGTVVHPLMLEPTTALRELLQVSASQDVREAWWSSTPAPTTTMPAPLDTTTPSAIMHDPATHDTSGLSPVTSGGNVSEVEYPPIPHVSDPASPSDPSSPSPSSLAQEASGSHRLGQEAMTVEPAPYWPMRQTTTPATAFAQPTLMLLGPITLAGARGTPPPRAERACAECCGWLLEHPGTTATAMAQGLLVAEGTRRSNMSRLRRWLGNDPQGHPYLPEAYSGRIWLDVAVTSDWQRLCLLIEGGIEVTTTDNLIQALKLVRGAPLADATPGQWHWSEELRTDMVSVIRDIGVIVTRRAVEQNNIDLARWAASRALVAAPEDELLLCARAETEHAAGNRMEVERLVAWITRNSRNLGVDLLPETIAILKRVIGENPRQWAAVERLAPATSPESGLGT